MKRLILITAAFLTLSVGLKAQQDAEYSMYMFNGLFLNPAYAGSKEVATISALYRHQWVKIEGAPRSGSFSMHSPLKKDQYAIGGLFAFDKLGLTDKYSAYLSYAYRVRMKNNDGKLSFGVQGGFSYYKHDLTDASLPISPIDASFGSNEKLFLPNFGFGVYYYTKRFYAGVSVPHLINLSLAEKFSNEATREDVARQYKHYNATVGAVLGKEDAKVKFKPSILVKYAKNTPVDFDINFSALFVDRFWAGISYRTGGDRPDSKFGKGESIIGLIEMKATPQLRIGYAYDMTLSSLSYYNSGSHEIMIGYDFGGKDEGRFVTPRYITYF